jgi:ribosome-binding factor A
MVRLLSEKLNKLLQKELEVPGALVTITEVTLSKDLEHATAQIAVLPKEKEGEAMRLLDAERKHFRHLLIKELNWRFIPEILFELDHGAENAAQVEKALLDAENHKSD